MAALRPKVLSIPSWVARPAAWRARVLRGESAEDIPYETISNSYLYVNPDALAAYGLTVPAELSERAIDVTAK